MDVATCCPELLRDPIADADAQTAARVFKALGDPARVRLVSLLASRPEGEACVCELVSPLELTQPTVSHHLKVLYDAGLLDRERRGTWVYYRLRRDAVVALRAALVWPADPSPT